jgi:hypothetical protein
MAELNQKPANQILQKRGVVDKLIGKYKRKTFKDVLFDFLKLDILLNIEDYNSCTHKWIATSTMSDGVNPHNVYFVYIAASSYSKSPWSIIWETKQLQMMGRCEREDKGECIVLLSAMKLREDDQFRPSVTYDVKLLAILFPGPYTYLKFQNQTNIAPLKLKPPMLEAIKLTYNDDILPLKVNFDGRDFFMPDWTLENLMLKGRGAFIYPLSDTAELGVEQNTADVQESQPVFRLMPEPGILARFAFLDRFHYTFVSMAMAFFYSHGMLMRMPSLLCFMSFWPSTTARSPIMRCIRNRRSMR